MPNNIPRLIITVDEDGTIASQCGYLVIRYYAYDGEPGFYRVYSQASLNFKVVHHIQRSPHSMTIDEFWDDMSAYEIDLLNAENRKVNTDINKIDARLAANADVLKKMEDSCKQDMAVRVTLQSGKEVMVVPCRPKG